MLKRLRIILYILTGLFLILTFVYFKIFSTFTSPEYFFTVPSFELMNEQGERFTRDKLDGKVWVANFMFTRCAGICPIMSANIAKLQSIFKSEKDLRFVSISVDPENDSPEILKKYGERYNANFDQWHFLTGERTVIEKLSREGFKLGSVDEPIFHSGKFIVVDRQATIRGYFDGNNPDFTSLENIQQTIKQLL